MRAYTLFVFVFVAVASATPNVLNEWTKPCTSGSCSYVAGGLGHGSSHAALSISGPTSALSDITSAAGWQVYGCPANWSSGAVHVTIRCEGAAAETSRCNALFEEDARDTIVRLPENCGTGPFARLVSSVDVTAPDGPLEHAVVLDYNFRQIAHSRGAVAFSVSSTSVGDSLQTYRRGRRSALAPRWGVSKTIDLPPISVHDHFTVFQTSISCPALPGGNDFSANLHVGVDVGLDAQVGFGFNVKGHIFPPKITKFNVFGKLNGSAEAMFDIEAAITGTLQTGNIPLFSLPLLGFSFPGIISVGPQFVINAQVNANLDLQAKLTAGVMWIWPDVQVNFPPDSGSSSAHASHIDTPFSLSVNPIGVSTTGNVNAHLIPRIELGVNILSGLAKANVYVSLDASASLDLQLDAQAVASATVDALPSSTTVDAPASETSTVDVPTSISTFDAPAPTPSTVVRALTSRAGSGSASASGCARLDGAIDVSAGVEGAIKPFFDKDISFDVFRTSINVFSTCFGKSSSKKRFVQEPRAAKRRGFVCPTSTSDLSQLLPVLDF